MSLSRALTAVTDAMFAGDEAITEVLASGALDDAPAEILVSLLCWGVSSRNILTMIQAHYAPGSEKAS
jgi:hypothetical protein